jgi:hypothetical protein
MSFSEALNRLKNQERIARSGWNGKGMFLVLIPASEWSTWNLSVDRTYQTLPWIGMKTADNHFVPWLASQTDILAEDWVLV